MNNHIPSSCIWMALAVLIYGTHADARSPGAADAAQVDLQSRRLGPGVRWLRSVRTQKCLRASGTFVDEGACGPARALRWMLQPTLVESSYVIRSIAENACLAAKQRKRGAAFPALEPCTFGPRQRWQATGPKGAPVQLRSLASQGCLALDGSGLRLSAQCGGGASQRFQLRYLHRRPRLLAWYEQQKTEAGATPIVGYSGGSYSVLFSGGHLRQASLDKRLWLHGASGFHFTLGGGVKPFNHKVIASSPVAVAALGSGASGAIGRATVEVCDGGSCAKRQFLAHVPDLRSHEVVLHTGEVRAAIPGPGRSWIALGSNLGGSPDSTTHRSCSLIKLGGERGPAGEKSRVLSRHDLGLPASVVCRRIARTHRGYVVAATVHAETKAAASQNDPVDLELIGLDARLEVLWRRRFPSATRDAVHDLRTTRSGALLVVGASVDFTGGTERPFVIKASPRGVQHWRSATSVSWPLGKGAKNIVGRELGDGSVALLIARASATRLVRLARDGGHDSGALVVGQGLPDLELWDMTCHADDRCVVAGTTRHGKQRVIGVGELQL